MSFKAGLELNISSHMSQSTSGLNVFDLISHSIDELLKMEEASVQREKSIYNQMCDMKMQWTQQAKETIRIRQARAYLEAPIPQHTSNHWTKDGDWHRISNMVYKMSWHSYERSPYRVGWSGKREHGTVWGLTWSITLNALICPPIRYDTRKIAGQSDKMFDEKKDMERYLQGRIAAYAHLFTEISPPIPKDDEKYFCVHGVLLPGYTVENPDALKPDETKVDELLAFLDDGDIGGAPLSPPPEPEPEPEPETPSPQSIWEKHRKQRTGTSQRKQAPTR